MSESDDDVTVDAEDVSIRKTLNDHQFETLAVVFDIRSGREHAAGVTLTDSIPDGVAIDDIGFHPEYGGEHWRADGETVVFSRTFEPGEQYTTVYGVRGFDDERGALLSEPAVEIDLDPERGGVEDIDDLVSEADSDLVREVISGERDTLPSLEDESTEAAAEAPAAGVTADGDDAEEPEEPAVADPAGGSALADDVESAEPDDSPKAGEDAAEEADEAETDDEGPEVDEVDEEPAVATSADDGAEADSVEEAEADAEPVEEPDDEITVPVTGGIARVLAKELRAGNVSYDDRRLLREELLPDDGSTDARIKRLQTQVADLAAYTDALERFLDAEGGAEAVIGDLESQVDDIAADVRGIQGGLSGVEDSVEAVEEDVQAVAGDVSAVEGDLDDVAADVDDVSGAVDRLSADVETIEDDLDRVDALDRRLDSIEDDVAAIHDELAELATFRDRLSSVFGAGGGPGGAEQPPEDGGADSDEDGGGYGSD